MTNFSHPFKMDGGGVPDRPCTLCGLPDRDPVHIPGPVDLNAPEPPPMPVPGATPIWQLVIEDMRRRHERGVAKYGQPLVARDGRKSLTDAYQEALDLAVYIRKEIRERVMNRVDADALVLTPLELAAPQLLAALKALWDWHGSCHSDDCQGDNRCTCPGKPINEAVTGALGKAQPTPTGDDPKAGTVSGDVESPKQDQHFL